jgi:hypothetical protein
MALLNPPDALPEAMRFLLRALLALREPDADRSELVGLVAPPGLREAMEFGSPYAADESGDDSDDDPRTGGGVIAERSLDHLQMLGLVKHHGRRVGLDDAATRRWKDPADVTPRSLADALLELVLEMADPEAPIGESSGVADFVQALVFLHTAGRPLHPFERFESAATTKGPARRSFASLQLKALGSDRDGWPVTNGVRWQSFRRWSSYLGLARPVGAAGLIPDASTALARRLPALAPGDYDVREFVARCAAAVPILDGGALQSGYDPQAEGEHAFLSGGLSVSLLQLEADGLLTLEKPRSDTGGRTLRLRPDGSADQRVTTVIWERTPVRRSNW